MIPKINSAHGSDTRNIINEIIKAINDRGLEILSESSFLNWLNENGVKHLGEWDNTKEYDRLSVVLHEGNSYTSKKLVPVGIEIENEEFWVLTGNYNAQIEYYQEYVDDEIRKNKTNLTDLVNVKNLGVISDGETDVTNELQSIINNNRYIYIPDGEYYFKQINVPSNTKIVFGKNVTLKSDVDLNDATTGVFISEGEVLERQYNVNQDINELESHLFISPSEVNNFKEGDIIEIQQSRPFERSSEVTTQEEHRQQLSYAILKVKDVDTSNGKIQFYEKIPYNFKKEYLPYLRKINANENVEIIGDNTLFDRMGVTNRGNFVHFKYCYNPRVEGLNCVNGAGKAVEMHMVNRFIINDITFSKPSITTVPFAEPIMINRSGFGDINNCYIYSSRRGIDFTNSFFCKANNCKGFDSRFTTHGMYSRFIEFNNCTVYGRNDAPNFYAFTFGNHSYMFDEHITLNNCNVYGSFYGLETVQFCNNITINNCNFTDLVSTLNFNDAFNIIINNTNFKECEFGMNFTDCTNVKINGVNLDGTTPYRTSTRSSISIQGESNKFIINNVKSIENKPQLLRLSSTHVKPNIFISDSYFENLSDGEYLNIGSSSHIYFENIKSNKDLRLAGKTNTVVKNSFFTKWVYGTDNEPISDFVIKNNILTDTIPTNIVTNEEKKIYIEDNILIDF